MFYCSELILSLWEFIGKTYEFKIVTPPLDIKSCFTIVCSFHFWCFMHSAYKICMNKTKKLYLQLKNNVKSKHQHFFKIFIALIKTGIKLLHTICPHSYIQELYYWSCVICNIIQSARSFKFVELLARYWISTYTKVMQHYFIKAQSKLQLTKDEFISVNSTHDQATSIYFTSRHFI